jgi:hypothetical protein
MMMQQDVASVSAHHQSTTGEMGRERLSAKTVWTGVEQLQHPLATRSLFRTIREVET